MINSEGLHPIGEIMEINHGIGIHKIEEFEGNKSREHSLKRMQSPVSTESSALYGPGITPNGDLEIQENFGEIQTNMGNDKPSKIVNVPNLGMQHNSTLSSQWEVKTSGFIG